MIELLLVGLLIFGFFMFGKSQKRLAIVAKFDDLRERRRTTQLNILNQYRIEFGLTPLRDDYGLHQIAKSHSVFMAENGKCSHDGEDKRVEKVQNITGTRYISENCFSYPSKEYDKRIDGRLVQGWIRSSGNRANILSHRYERIGIGIVSRNGHVYVTQLFSG
jgi:uncharacterized protein YkwD